MDRFWKWFEHKTGFMKLSWINHNRENWKANLIGHMEEYLLVIHSAGIGNRVNIYKLLKDGKSFLDARYEQLEIEIEEVIGGRDG